MVKRIDPTKAAPKPATLKSGVKLAASMSIKAFKMKVNNPKVRILIGSVRSKSTGFTRTLISPIMMIATIAVPKSLISIPGTILATINKAKALINHLMTIPILLWYHIQG